MGNDVSSLCNCEHGSTRAGARRDVRGDFVSVNGRRGVAHRSKATANLGQNMAAGHDDASIASAFTDTASPAAYVLYTTSQCSNERERSCQADSDCFSGGVCEQDTPSVEMKSLNAGGSGAPLYRESSGMELVSAQYPWQIVRGRTTVQALSASAKSVATTLKFGTAPGAEASSSILLAAQQA